jgi:hypothetical protein
MQPEAQAILDVFQRRGIRSGGLVSFTDFGEAMPWKDGFIRVIPCVKRLSRSWTGASSLRRLRGWNSPTEASNIFMARRQSTAPVCIGSDNDSS